MRIKMYSQYLGTVVLFVLMFSTLIILAGEVNAATITSVNKNIDSQYDKKIKKLRDNSCCDVYYKYVDITGDGMHEAFVYYKPVSQGGSGWTFDVYTYKNHTIKRMCNTVMYGLSKVMYYTNTKSIVLYHVGHGTEHYWYFKYRNGKLIFVARKDRESLAGGGSKNCKWAYGDPTKKNKYENWKSVTKSDFNKLIKGIEKGKKKTLHIEKWKSY